MGESMTSEAIDALWEYGDPAESERRFRTAIESLPETSSSAVRLELLTQVARTLGLRRRFEEAHAVLDEVEPQLDALADEVPLIARVRTRLLLERGRAFNSAGERDRARALFMEAWDIGRSNALDGLAVDAAHMVAITHGGTAMAIDWNRRGLELARASADAKACALMPAMLNNMAWDLHELGRLGEALAAFMEALDAWTERGRKKQIHIAQWSVARCLRSLGRHEDALEILLALEAERADPGRSDGFVLEEIGENLEATGALDAARPYFARAAKELAKIAWFVEREGPRLARLQQRGGTASTD